MLHIKDFDITIKNKTACFKRLSKNLETLIMNLCFRSSVILLCGWEDKDENLRLSVHDLADRMCYVS